MKLIWRRKGKLSEFKFEHYEIKLLKKLAEEYSADTGGHEFGAQDGI